MIDIFAWAPTLPREMFEDKFYLYDVLPAEWEHLLRERGGIRIPGPLNMQIIEYGYIDDNTLQPVVLDKYGRRVQYVIVRVSGLAVRP